MSEMMSEKLRKMTYYGKEGEGCMYQQCIRDDGREAEEDDLLQSAVGEGREEGEGSVCVGSASSEMGADHL